jgi:alpha-N-arabinofuranosidase
MYASLYGRGTALKAELESDTYTVDDKKIPYIYASAVDTGSELIIYAINRSLDSDIALDLDISGYGKLTLTEHIELYHEDLKVTNTKDAQNVKPSQVELSPDGKINLKKHSWNMVRFKY